MNPGPRPTSGTLPATYSLALEDRPPLGDSELKRLVRKARKGDKAAFDTVVEANLRFVVQVALSYNAGSHLLEDLVAEGNIGLIEAARRFDPDLGYRFSTYAVWWIRRRMQTALRASMSVVSPTSHQMEDLSKIRQVDRALTQVKGRDVNPGEIASHLGVSEERVHATMAAGHPDLSLDKPVFEDGEDSLYGRIPGSGPLPDTVAMTEEVQRHVRQALQSLTPREADIIRRVFGLEGSPQTLTHIAECQGVSRERIRQIKAKALQILRRRLAAPQPPARSGTPYRQPQEGSGNQWHTS